MDKNLDNVVKERPLLPIERLFASMDRVDHQKLLSTPSSTMPYADAAGNNAGNEKPDWVPYKKSPLSILDCFLLSLYGN